eukprot:1160683-Pelagomonas_calceolata.AAC.5
MCIGLLNSNSETLREVLKDLHLHSRTPSCWTAQILDVFKDLGDAQNARCVEERDIDDPQNFVCVAGTDDGWKVERPRSLITPWRSHCYHCNH